MRTVAATDAATATGVANAPRLPEKGGCIGLIERLFRGYTGFIKASIGIMWALVRVLRDSVGL